MWEDWSTKCEVGMRSSLRKVKSDWRECEGSSGVPGAGTVGGRAANRFPRPAMPESVRSREGDVRNFLPVGPDVISISTERLSLLSLSLVERLFCSVEAGRALL